MTVSQLLDPGRYSFDLVIFDEASQICAEDAVGAIYRAQQVVVAIARALRAFMWAIAQQVARPPQA